MSFNTVVIYGSNREERHGIKAARFLMQQLELRGHETTLLDSMAFELPLLNRMYREYAPGEAPAVMTEISEILTAADGFVVVTGEYNHSTPPALKNLLDHFGPEYRRKASAIVSYSIGPFGGVRGVGNLRNILATLGSPTLPASFSISQVNTAFDEAGTALDSAYERRIKRFLDDYEWFAGALKAARAGA